MTHFEPDDTDDLRAVVPDPTDDAPDTRFAPEGDGGSLEVDLGQSLPPAPFGQVMVPPVVQAGGAQASPVGEFPHSTLAEGLFFTGHGVLKGPCTVACHITGNLAAAHGHVVSVVITETGVVDGDITADKIAVLGHTNGVLDSGMGDVVLYESASVQGLVRYGRIQVNGADLNATLERMVRK